MTATVHSPTGEACLEPFVVVGGIDEIAFYVARLRTTEVLTAVEYSFLAGEESPSA